MSRQTNFIQAFMAPRQQAQQRASGWLARIMRQDLRLAYALYQYERAACAEQVLAYREQCAKTIVGSE